MKTKYLVPVLFVCLILLLVSCSCKHQWNAATCESPKTCAKCGETEGDISNHTPGKWSEAVDLNQYTKNMEQVCTECGLLLESKTESLETTIQDGMFLFTAEQFLDRIVHLARQDSVELTYEIISDGEVPLAKLYFGEHEALVQFFSRKAVTLDPKQAKAGDIWCVSYITVGETTPEPQYYFMIACDPTLDMDQAFDLEVSLVVALANASQQGQSMGYHEQNDLLHEIAYIPDGNLGMNGGMHMHNIYASSFLE